MSDKHDRAAELRAIADGRLMLNVRNGVTVSRSMLAMIADEFEAMSTALAAKDAELENAIALLETQAKLYRRAEAQLAEANKALEQHREDRPYIIGWNHGFEEAMGGPLIFPNMLRKMWSGSEVQAWIDNEITARRAREQGGE